MLQPDDEIALTYPKRMVAQYGLSEDGRRELRLFYGAKEVSFDEEDLFAFGEGLARAGRFRAAEATNWGDGYPWERLQPLLNALVEERILVRVEDAAAPAESSRARPSPLAPASCPAYRSWRDAEAITRDLAGRAVEPGYLEVFVPVFRAAHTALDRDGRQIGEANVFPRALRLEAETQWVACLYPGTRHQAAAPMNLTALKAMREHWPAMMAMLLRIRAAFARRLPGGVFRATVGGVERLAVAALGLPSYEVLRWDRPEAPLHPALSSLFRVTDGLRMTMHQMLFVPVGEPTLAPDTPVDARLVHDYAERNHSFFSDTGVCAGPRMLVQEFLEVLIEGSHGAKYASTPLPAELEAALADIDAALDYAFLGLQTHAFAFSLWPRMTRAYVEIDSILSAPGSPVLQAVAARFRAHAEALANSPYLTKEAWRADREQVYLDMRRACAEALEHSPNKAPRREPASTGAHARPLALDIAGALTARFGPDPRLAPLSAILAGFAALTQSLLQSAQASQARINQLLARPAPRRPLDAFDLDVHHRLQGAEARRLPYLLDELREAFGLDFLIDSAGAALKAASGGPE